MKVWGRLVVLFAARARLAAAQIEAMDCEEDWCMGCAELNYCNGHGRCAAGGGQGSPFVTCKCFKGWGSPDDIAIDKDMMCSLRPIPGGVGSRPPRRLSRPAAA